MSTLPASLQKILAAQKPAKAFVPPEKKGDLTTIWRDGEVVRERKGRVYNLPSVPALS